MWTKRSRKCYEQTPRISAIFFIISCNILKSATKTLSKLQKHLHIKSSHPRITAPNSEFEPKFFWDDGNSVFIDSYYRQGETQAGSLSQRLKIQHFRKKVFNFDHYPSLFEPPDFHYWLLCRLTSSILSKMEENSPIHWHGSLCSTDVLSRSQRLLLKSPFLLHEYSNSSPLPSFSQAHSLSPALGCTNLAPWGNTETTAKFTFQQTFSIQALH